MRCFMHLSYCGAAYHGWQTQPHDVSVQSTLEDAVATLVRRPVALTGAGRTDAGVNARMMIAHLDLPDDIDTGARFVKALNSLTPRDIAIYSLTPVADDAHARFDATERTYHYYMHTAPDPFIDRLSWQAPATLDFNAMNKAAAMLVGRRDFTSFSKLHTDTVTNICDLRRAYFEQTAPNRYRFVISADRFLRNMVRAVAGTLVDVGRGKIRPADVMRIIDAHDRCAAGTSMPAHALYLWDIVYPYYHAEIK